MPSSSFCSGELLENFTPGEMNLISAPDHSYPAVLHLALACLHRGGSIWPAEALMISCWRTRQELTRYYDLDIVGSFSEPISAIGDLDLDPITVSTIRRTIGSGRYKVIIIEGLHGFPQYRGLKPATVFDGLYRALTGPENKDVIPIVTTIQAYPRGPGGGRRKRSPLDLLGLTEEQAKQTNHLRVSNYQEVDRSFDVTHVPKGARTPAATMRYRLHRGDVFLAGPREYAQTAEMNEYGPSEISVAKASRPAKRRIPAYLHYDHRPFEGGLVPYESKRDQLKRQHEERLRQPEEAPLNLDNLGQL